MSEGLPAIRLEGLAKRYRVPRREGGLWAALRSLVQREYDEVDAVADLSFEVDAGERVGFLGPNGAGKTTTLKMLAGLLHPTGGRARVLGFEPRKREAAFLRSVALVMGQKRQLSWDLPAVDTFELNRVVYGVSTEDYRRRLDEMVELLEVGTVMHRPVRQLSLGERMKCELIAALLHRPQVLFLDEPTIGMDVSMQHAIRDFVRDYNERYAATVVLTSHYMEDVAALCPRVILIDEGRLAFDGPIEDLRRRVRPQRRVRVLVDQLPERAELERLGTVITFDDGAIALDVEAPRVPEAVSCLVGLPGARQLAIEDPPLDDIMRTVFAEKPLRAATGPTAGEGQGA